MICNLIVYNWGNEEIQYRQLNFISNFLNSSNGIHMLLLIDEEADSGTCITPQILQHVKTTILVTNNAAFQPATTQAATEWQGRLFIHVQLSQTGPYFMERLLDLMQLSSWVVPHMNTHGKQLPFKVLHHRSPRVAENQFSKYEPLFTWFKWTYRPTLTLGVNKTNGRDASLAQVKHK